MTQFTIISVADVEPAELAEVYNLATGTQDAQPEHASTTAQCPNNWHTTARVRSLILCPECPAAVREMFA